MPPKRRFSILSIFLSSLFFFIACEKKAPVEIVESIPTISVYSIPDLIKQNSSIPVLFMVQAADPQGLNDLSQVNFSLINEMDLILIAPAPMYDTGLDGDIIRNDGVYTYQLTPKTSNLSPGKFFVHFQAIDHDGNESEIAMDTVLVESGGDGSAPTITTVDFPESLSIDSDTVLTLVVRAEDEDGDLNGLDLSIYQENSLDPFLSATLILANNNEFRMDLNTSIFTQTRSNYLFRFSAFDLLENKSKPVVRKFYLERTASNDPPQVLAVTAPDTISRSGANTFLLTAQVTDPDGLSDIAEVTMNSFLPGGTPSSGNPFFLRDDGIGGDMTENDGIYSSTFTIGQSNATGTYRFDIQAKDKAGQLSNIVSHSITVIE